MPENPKAAEDNETVRERIAGKVKPQNQHYNVKKQALGPNSKRG